MIDVAVSRPVLSLDEQAVRSGTTPNVLGLSVDQATQVFIDAGLDPGSVAIEQVPFGGAPGLVLVQDPRAGTTLGDTATVSVSQATAMPTVAGARLSDVRAALDPLGVRVVVRSQYQAGTAQDTVLSSEPTAGAPLTSEVSLVVAEAPSSVFLSSLRPISSSCSVDSVSINATEMPSSLSCSPSYDDGDVVEFLLNRHVERFQAQVGVVDRSESTIALRFRVLVDGQVAFDQQVAYGTVADVDVSIAGAIRLQLEVYRAQATEECCGVIGGWGDAQLTGGQAEVDDLVEESNQ